MNQGEYHNPTVLSDRQHQVAQLLSEDYTQEEIAEELEISQSTLRTIERNLKIKRNKIERTMEFFDSHNSS